MASYPSQVALFPTHVNITDIIDAAHPNNIQSEVVAIETIVGTDPSTSTTPNPSGTFNASSSTYLTLKDRIANIETGIVSDSHTQYLRKNADSGNVITPSGSGVKGLVVKARSDQTANLQEWQLSDGTVVSFINKDGNFIGIASGNVNLSTVTSVGDLIVGNGVGSVTRLGIGSNNFILASNGTTPYWTNTLSVQGPTGAQGTQGTQGIQGTQGVYGIQGFTGSQGTQGTQGLQGVQGTTGSQGIQGNIGTQGSTGTQGNTGVQGATGAQGVQGATGTQGTVGAQGTQGITGSQGTTGLQGAQGNTGTQGIQGFGYEQLQGTQGFTGSQGTQGNTGTQGIQGFGYSQLQGTQGFTGSQGTQGLQGLQGLQGVFNNAVADTYLSSVLFR